MCDAALAAAVVAEWQDLACAASAAMQQQQQQRLQQQQQQALPQNQTPPIVQGAAAIDAAATVPALETADMPQQQKQQQQQPPLAHNTASQEQQRSVVPSPFSKVANDTLTHADSEVDGVLATVATLRCDDSCSTLEDSRSSAVSGTSPTRDTHGTGFGDVKLNPITSGRAVLFPICWPACPDADASSSANPTASLQQQQLGGAADGNLSPWGHSGGTSSGGSGSNGLVVGSAPASVAGGLSASGYGGSRGSRSGRRAAAAGMMQGGVSPAQLSPRVASTGKRRSLAGTSAVEPLLQPDGASGDLNSSTMAAGGPPALGGQRPAGSVGAPVAAATPPARRRSSATGGSRRGTRMSRMATAAMSTAATAVLPAPLLHLPPPPQPLLPAPPAVSAATRTTVTVEVHQLGMYAVKGAPGPVEMVEVILSHLAGRRAALLDTSTARPGGKGRLLTPLSAKCAAVAGVTLPAVAETYRSVHDASTAAAAAATAALQAGAAAATAAAAVQQHQHKQDQHAKYSSPVTALLLRTLGSFSGGAGSSASRGSDSSASFARHPSRSTLGGSSLWKRNRSLGSGTAMATSSPTAPSAAPSLGAPAATAGQQQLERGDAGDTGRRSIGDQAV